MPSDSLSLYQRVIGDAYATMPEPVQAMHAVTAAAIVVTAAGESEVSRGSSLLAKFMGRMLGLPPAGAYPIKIRFIREAEGKGDAEVLERRYGPYVFRSRQESIETDRGLRLVETMGPVAIIVRPEGSAAGIEFIVEETRLGRNGPKLPQLLRPRIVATERGDAEGRYLFDVHVSTPLAGLVVHYRGWLRVQPV